MMYFLDVSNIYCLFFWRIYCPFSIFWTYLMSIVYFLDVSNFCCLIFWTYLMSIVYILDVSNVYCLLTWLQGELWLRTERVWFEGTCVWDCLLSIIYSLDVSNVYCLLSTNITTGRTLTTDRTCLIWRNVCLRLSIVY